jgi:hypothetical protein
LQVICQHETKEPKVLFNAIFVGLTKIFARARVAMPRWLCKIFGRVTWIVHYAARRNDCAFCIFALDKVIPVFFVPSCLRSLWAKHGPFLPLKILPNFRKKFEVVTTPGVFRSCERMGDAYKKRIVFFDIKRRLRVGGCWSMGKTALL